MDYEQIFRRVEKKYLIDDYTYNLLLKRLSDYIVPDKFPRSSIRNIYYDTKDHRLIRNSLEKPVYKEKFRIRCYGDIVDSSTVFVELKKKFQGVVYKRRVGMTLEQSKAFLSTKNSIGENQQIENEILYFLQYYNPIPSMFISYDRLSFCGKYDENFRITFDYNILYRENDLLLENAIGGKQLISNNQKVMEIKIPNAMPIWLSKIFDDLNIYPTSFSKYGKAYLETMNSKEKVEYYV